MALIHFLSVRKWTHGIAKANSFVFTFNAFVVLFLPGPVTFLFTVLLLIIFTYYRKQNS